jgi:hypothetical protein
VLADVDGFWEAKNRLRYNISPLRILFLIRNSLFNIPILFGGTINSQLAIAGVLDFLSDGSRRFGIFVEPGLVGRHGMHGFENDSSVRD